MYLSNEQWEHIQTHLPKPKRIGRPRHDNREILNGILWILRTGARWQDLPDKYPSYQTCHRRFQEWVRLGVIQKILEQIAQELHNQGDIDLSECFIDGTFSPAKKGASILVKPKKVKAQRLWPSQMLLVFQRPASGATQPVRC